MLRSFVCDNCLKAKNEKRKENKYNARKLPTTKLGTYIETRVNNFLKKKESGAGEVTVRVVSSSEKIVEVKPGMKSRQVSVLFFIYFFNSYQFLLLWKIVCIFDFTKNLQIFFENRPLRIASYVLSVHENVLKNEPQKVNIQD